MEAKAISKTVKNIALIGAGVSNLTFLHSLNISDNVRVNIFERSKVISGRAATRKREEFFFDNGANYFNALDQKVEDIILNKLNKENLVTIKKWIFPFDKDFNIDYDMKKAEIHNNKTKYTYKKGINHLGELLLESIKVDYDLKFSKNVTKIKQLDNKNWQLFSEKEDLGNFEYIIFGIPSPNIARVLMNSDFIEDDKEFFEKSIDAFNDNTYNKTFSLSIALEKSEINYEEFSKFFALINSDRKNPISWVCLENEKNRGELDLYQKNIVLIVQMSNEFSIAYQNTPKEEVLILIMKDFYKLFPTLKNIKINYSDLKLWGHSLPSVKLSDKIVEDFAKKNIFIIGDSLIGKGRVDGAMLTGLDLYEKLFPKF
jgi:predicted NAD/FAD-dependent oxidoreductase